MDDHCGTVTPVVSFWPENPEYVAWASSTSLRFWTTVVDVNTPGNSSNDT